MDVFSQPGKAADLDDLDVFHGLIEDRRRLTQAKLLEKTQKDDVPLIVCELMLEGMQELFIYDLILDTREARVRIPGKK